MQLAFTFQSKYLGMVPWNCPGAFSFLSYIELAYGIYHNKGGVHQPMCIIWSCRTRRLHLKGSLRFILAPVPKKQMVVVFWSMVVLFAWIGMLNGLYLALVVTAVGFVLLELARRWFGGQEE